MGRRAGSDRRRRVIPAETVDAARRALGVLLAAGVVGWSWGLVLAPLWVPVYIAVTAPAVRMVTERVRR